MSQPLTWLIVGASPKSFGEALSHAVLARGDKVIATARDASKLGGLEKAGAKTLELDICAEQGELDKKAKVALELADEGFIDVLVISAGTTMMSTVEEVDPEDLRREFQTNTFGPIALTRAFLPSYRAAAKRPGTLVFITSASGINGFPGSGTYAASKHALEGFVDSLQQETRSSTMDLRCLVIESGFIRTNFINNASGFSTKFAEYQPLADFLQPFINDMNGNQPGDPRKHAEIVVDVVKDQGAAKGKVVDPYGGDWPLRLPIGPDAYAAAKKRAEGYLKVLESWGEVIQGTNFDE